MTTKPTSLIADGHVMKRMVKAGLAWLEYNQEHVNQLNVYPVPDGDTGTNMVMTMRKAVEYVENLEDRNFSNVVKTFAKGARMGARGNSGVILSELWNGFAEGVGERSTVDAEVFAAACKVAIEKAYGAVQTPVEGTILTVSREASEAVIENADGEPDLIVLLEKMVAAGRESLKRTPELLPVLANAGVVDSGGQGFVYMIEGMIRLINNEEVHLLEDLETLHTDWESALVPDDEEGYGYDVQFLMHGENLDVVAVREKIESMGWSTLVVGDSQLIKVHVHVHNPGEPLSYAVGLGIDIDDVVVENLQRQYHTYVEERQARESTGEPEIPDVPIAVVAVAVGDGIEAVYRNKLEVGGLGTAAVIAGGQTMNPSTEDFFEVIKKLPHDKIILLPNNKNIFMSAQQAATLAADIGKQVKVVPSRTIPQGITAMFAYHNALESADLDQIAEEMTEALSHVVTGEVTTATRTTTVDEVNIKEGDYIGLLDGKIVVSNAEIMPVVQGVLQKVNTDEHELVTIYYGSDIDAARAESAVEALEEAFPELEFEIVSGGQPLYPYIISVE